MIEAAAALDLVVTAALKAASSEVVKKSIGALSERLGFAFESKDHAQIKKIIEEDNLIDPLAKIAQAGIDQSIIFSLNKTDLSSPTYKTELFHRIIELGFRISNINKVDVVLNGSLLDNETLSVFSTRKNMPDLVRQGVSIQINVPNVFDGYYSILPNTNKNKEIVTAYKEQIRDIRQDTLDKYITFPQIFSEDHWAYSLQNATAGSVFFKYDENARLVSTDATGNKIKIRDFSSGIRSMLADVKDYPNLPHLSDKERYEIENLLQGLKDLGI